MSNQVFVRGTWKIRIFIYQDEKMGWGKGGGEGDARLVFWAMLRCI